jgi:hypothetical protein
LTGDLQRDRGAVWLRWQPVEGPVSGYRIHRGPQDAVDALPVLADLPADVTAYQDVTAACGQVYYVTALVSGGAGPVESPPSTRSYYAPPCP